MPPDPEQLSRLAEIFALLASEPGLTQEEVGVALALCTSIARRADTLRQRNGLPSVMPTRTVYHA
jgi:hypothetical protein